MGVDALPKQSADPVLDDPYRRHAVELKQARESLIATLTQLPPAWRDQVLQGGIRRPRGRFPWSYERMQGYLERLRALGNDTDDPELALVVDSARALWRRLHRAREALVMDNLGIVPHVVREFHTGDIPMGDLIQDGYIGLLKAVDRYDPDRGYKFSTYACWWIRRALNDAFSYRARLIRLPEYVRRDLRRLRETTSELTTELDRPPTDREIAARTGWTRRTIRKLRDVVAEPRAIEDLANERGEGYQGCLGEARGPDPLSAIINSELIEKITLALEQLSPREQSIIKMRYGFDRDGSMTLQSIANVMGVSRERIRQIESVAMDKIARWARRAHIAS
jgi:RNA polymerase primary sigma factor